MPRTLMETPITKQGIDQHEFSVSFDRAVPFGRLGQPEDDAAPLIYLVPPAAYLGAGTAVLIAGGGTA